MERFVQDLRFGARLLWKDRGFSVTALLTLAVCVGANAAIFAIINSVLLRPLPFPEADRLALFYNSYPGAGVERGSSGVPDYYDRLRETDVFEEQALFTVRGQTIGGEADPQRVTGMNVTPSFFRMLRAQPLRGRIFNEEEGEIGRDRSVILSYSLWQQAFGGSDSAIGRDMRLNGVQHTVVGVMPAGFSFMDPDVVLWKPLGFTAEQKSDDGRHNNSWTMVGRLKPGATVEQAQQQVDALNGRNMERFPNMKEVLTNAGFRSVVVPLHQDLVSGVRPTLYLLWGGALFVLSIGVVNLTNLVLVRSSARMRELATRHALGAGLSRLTGQLLTETVMLTVLGGISGVAVGFFGLKVLAGAGLGSLPRASEISMDATAVGYTLALAFGVGLLVALVPVLNMRHMNLSQAFREDGRSGTTGRGARVFRRTLVATQVAFAFMLLIGAGLLLASFQRVLSVDPGFNPANLLTARVSPPARYADDASLRAFSGRLLESLRATAGITHVGLASTIPFGGDFSDSVILAEGYQMTPGESLISPYRVAASPGYTEALGVPLRSGRTFTDSDTADAPLVVMVDERLARRFWPGADPVGRRMFRPDNAADLTRPNANTRWLTVVGVVGETKMAGLVTTEDRAGVYYFPLAQDVERTITVVARTQGEPTSVTSAIRQQLRSIDPEMPLYSVQTMEERMNQSLTDRRTPMVLALIFAGVALFLAAIGIYGMLAYQVAQRTKEIGIRLALGSDARAIFALVLKEGVALLAVGLVAGVAGAFAIRRTMEAQLFGVGAMDPVVLASVGAVLGVVAVAACLLPARRAAATSPLTALNVQ